MLLTFLQLVTMSLCFFRRHFGNQKRQRWPFMCFWVNIEQKVFIENLPGFSQMTSGSNPNYSPAPYFGVCFLSGLKSFGVAMFATGFCAMC